MIIISSEIRDSAVPSKALSLQIDHFPACGWGGELRDFSQSGFQAVAELPRSLRTVHGEDTQRQRLDHGLRLEEQLGSMLVC